MDPLLALLDQLAQQYHAAYPNSQRATDFDAHLATVRMIVEHSADEESKKVEA